MDQTITEPITDHQARFNDPFPSVIPQDVTAEEAEAAMHHYPETGRPLEPLKASEFISMIR